MPHNYVAAGACYVVSGLLDALDGHAARYLNQSMHYFVLLFVQVFIFKLEFWLKLTL